MAVDVHKNSVTARGNKLVLVEMEFLVHFEFYLYIFYLNFFLCNLSTKWLARMFKNINL